MNKPEKPGVSPAPGTLQPRREARSTTTEALVTPRTAELIASLTPAKQGRAPRPDVPHLLHPYVGNLDDAFAQIAGRSHGLVFVFGAHEQTTLNALAARLHENDIRWGYVTKYLEKQEPDDTRVLFLFSGPDAVFLNYAASIADDRIVIVSGFGDIESCDETIATVYQYLDYFKRTDSRRAILTWGAVLRNLRFFVRTQLTPKGPLASVYAASRLDEKDTALFAAQAARKASAEGQRSSPARRRAIAAKLFSN